MIRVDVEEVQDGLEELLEAALRGEEVIFEERGIPQAMLVLISPNAEDDPPDRPKS